MNREHTDHEYESELRKLRDQLLYMGAKVEEMIASSIKALVERDSDLARRMMEFDTEIDRLEVDTDDLCLRILARRQPVASDLRAITIAMKMVTDLERIGDLGVNICERVVELSSEPPLKPYMDLPKMSEIAQGMVRDALDAFVNRDAERAQEVIEHDGTVDVYYGQIFRELLTYMMEDVRNIYRATRLQSIAKYLERIGDHATNLAEMVVFMVKGKDIRHLGHADADAQAHLPHGVLFACVQNSARSQMAEGLARKLLPPSVRVWSAGSKPADAIHPLAVKAMQELGIDISGQRPKGFGDVPIGDVDTVVMLCAEEKCVTVPVHAPLKTSWPLTDPVAVTGSEEARLEAFRKVRDELRTLIETLKPV
jgi:phosphate transport system protein